MWPNSQFLGDLVTFTEKFLNGKLHFCAVLALKKKAVIFSYIGSAILK